MHYKKFSSIDLKDDFFDSLKQDYAEFENWFRKKSDNNESAYVFYTEDKIQGFLYLKRETEEIADVDPILPENVRIKIGTFKINPHGTRLGERFMKKIFDFAVVRDIEEIYVTVFEKHQALIQLFLKYGFEKYGIKETANGKEAVLLKKIHSKKSIVSQNYPLIQINKSYLLSIWPEYHSRLFPDSLLNSESYDIIKDVSHTNSIHKIYVCYMDVSKLKQGDIIIIYRTSDGKGPAHYRSVVTSVCVVEELKTKADFNGVEEYLNYCKDYSVFEQEELRSFYNQNKKHFFVVKMTYNAAFAKRVTRGVLIEELDINSDYWGFFELTKDQFLSILRKGEINESIVVD